MKMCNCGFQNEDTDNFCKQCGSQLNVQQQAPVQEQTVQQEQAEYQQTATNPFPMLSALKEKGAGGLFLVTVILYTLNVIISIVSAFSVDNQVNNALNAYGEMGVDVSDAMAISQGVSTGTIVGTLIGCIPVILLCIGLWKIYGTCKKSGSQPLSTGGFSLVKGVVIFELVVFCIAIAIIAIALIFVSSVAASKGYSLSEMLSSAMVAEGLGYGEASDLVSLIVGAIGVFIVLMFVVMILGIIYFAKVIGSLNRAKEIIVTGKTNKNVSAFVGVFTMIGGILNTISGLVSDFDFATILAGVCSILFAVLIFSMRGAIKRAK